jgi:hypothetical protein
VSCCALPSTLNVIFSLDWMRFIQIVDPSIYDANPSGMKINCFTKHHANGYPPQILETSLSYTASRFCRSHLLSLINSHFSEFQILNFQGCLVGTGYHDKLTWAACSPPGRIHHGPPNEAPREAALRRVDLVSAFLHFINPPRMRSCTVSSYLTGGERCKRKNKSI